MKAWTTREGRQAGGKPIAKNSLYNLLTNMIYLGKVEYGGQVYEGEHERIVDDEIWNQVQTHAQPEWPARRPQYRQQTRRAAQGPGAMRHLRRRHDPHLRPQEESGSTATTCA